MTQEQRDGKDRTMYFVRDGNKRPTTAMAKAFSLVKKFGFDAKYIDEENVQELLQVQNMVYIFIFQCQVSPLLEPALRQGSRVFGPLCILATQPFQQNRLPTRKSAVFNLAMRTACVTSSGLRNEEKREVEKKIHLMGGIYTKELLKSVTHIVADNITSKKCTLARKLGIPIMDPRWVESCWNKSQEDVFDGTSKVFVSKHRLPVFHELSICVSQLELRERQSIESTVIKNGGKYSGELNVKTVTHLVLKEPKGQKYDYVKNLQHVFTVKPEWVKDSIQEGYALCEGIYTVASSEAERCSSSGKLNDDVFANDHITADDDPVIQLPSFQKARTEKTSSTFIEAVPQNIAELENYPSSSRYDPTLFDNYDFFIVGCDAKLDACIRTLAPRCGAHVSDTLRDSVTHVIVGSNFTSAEKSVLKEKLSTINNGCHVLTLDWLMTSIIKNTPADIKTHAHVLNSENISQQSDLFQTPVKPSSSLSKNSEKIEDYDILSQYENRITDCSKHGDAEDVKNIQKPLPLQGCVVTFSGYSPEEKTTLIKILSDLGGLNQDHFNRFDDKTKGRKRNTHLVIETASGQKYLVAKSWNVICVTKKWLLKCQTIRDRANEEDFVPKQVSVRGAEILDKEHHKGHTSSLENSKNALEIAHTVERKNKIDLPSHLTQNRIQRTQEAVNSPSIFSQQNDQAFLPKQEVANGRGMQVKNNSDLKRLQENIKSLIGESGDSQAFVKDERILYPVDIEEEPDLPCSVEVTWRAVNEITSQKSVSDINSQKPRKFMCTGYNKQESEFLLKVIEKLGGTLIIDERFDVTCTHLIMKKPKRNTKFFCSIASGKWVLHNSFITDSEKLGHFADEKKYEYGGPSQDEFQFEEHDKGAAAAANRWRLKLKLTGGKGAFEGMKILVVSKNRCDNFASIISAGGGFAEKSANMIFSKEQLQNVDFAVVDVPKEYKDNVNQYIEPLKQRNIECIAVVYLADYLILSPSPGRASYQVEKYQRLSTQKPETSVHPFSSSNPSMNSVFSERSLSRGGSSSSGSKRLRLA